MVKNIMLLLKLLWEPYEEKSKKNEGILIFTKIQREYKEGKKLIQFHKNINKIK